MRIFKAGILFVAGLLFAAGLMASLSERMTYEFFAKLYERIMTGGESAAQLEDAIPGLSRKLTIASEVSHLYWTESTPFDALAKAYILPEKVMNALGIRHEISQAVMHVPAGLMHSYGYLFSQLQTSYGLKGKRWIESRIDERLGLAAGTFSPFAGKGEFLSNVTLALSRVLCEEVQLRHAAKLNPKVKLLGRVTEHVSWKMHDGAVKTATIDTHLAELGAISGLETTDTVLLIYSMVGEEGRRRFVTAFPIDQKFADSIIATTPMTDTLFKPRFNLYLDPAWSVIEHRNEGFERKTSR